MPARLIALVTQIIRAKFRHGHHRRARQPEPDHHQFGLEGVPQRAIARALQLPANEVVEVVADAVARGIIAEPSESEWPQGSRAPRHPSFAGPPVDEATLLIAATQSLALTKTQAALFLALVRRKFCTKEILHDVVESRRWAHSTPTDRKIVGVIICSIRKRLRGRYTIQTVQAAATSSRMMTAAGRPSICWAASGLRSTRRQ